MKRIRIGTISETFDHVLESEPDRTALVTSGSLSYRELDAAANAAAATLVEFGVRPGDRVAASLPNDASCGVPGSQPGLRRDPSQRGLPTADDP